MAVAALMSICLPLSAQALPDFARKYEKNCGMCHTQVPRLNKTGYEFRMAGYRLPDEIGKAEKDSDFNLGDFFAVAVKGGYTYQKHSVATNAAASTSSSNLEFEGASLYPLTGSWGRWFGSFGELFTSPDNVFEIESALVRAVYGDASGWFETRLGVMHPWEGFGASDRPIGISQPLIQDERPTGSPFSPMSANEMAWEIGYYFQRTGTTLSARIGNGILWKGDGSGMAEPAQGGNLTKPSNLPARNAKSYTAVVNQFITDDSGLTLYYHRTAVPTPNPFDPTPLSCTPGTPSGCTKDSIERLALYANYYVMPKLLDFLAGYGWGNDKVDDPTLDPSLAAIGKSKGYYAEINYFPIEHQFATGLRYDSFDPSDKVSHDRITQYSVFGNWSVYKGLQLIGEYKLKDSQVGSGTGTDRDHQFKLLCVFVM